MTNTTEYQIWQNMIDRCTNSRNSRYGGYGGRGIRVCARWKNSFVQFYSDMGRRPKGKTLDRENNNGNYEPGNCRWATSGQQNRNKRSNRHIRAFGKTMVLSEWARELGISACLLHYHLKVGKTIEQIVRERKPVLRRCFCGTPFETIIPSRKYCSDRCSELARARRRYPREVAA